ncbi:MAG TPA: hypothetical protein VLB27_04645, partial [candidate division Zixibacteria bacterium]|nr:hypothetical protein [candidate division Zixibacteria bacterium]
MNRKFLLKSSVSLGLLGLFTVGSVFGLDTDTKEKIHKAAVTSRKFAVAADSRSHSSSQGGSAATAGQYIGATSAASSLGCTPASVNPAKGITVGCTFYEYQKNGSMGRQIVTDPVFHVMNYSWMNQDNNSATGGRNVRYEGWDPAFGALGDGTGGVDVGGDLIPPNRSGYVTMAGLSDGTAINSHHWNPTFDVGVFRAYTFKNSTPGLADFATEQLPDSVWASFDNGTPGSGDQFIWPQVAHTDLGPTQITHLIIHNDNTNNTVGGNFLYTRRVGSTGTAWSHGRQFGWGGYLSPTVCASPQSLRVGIAFTGGRGTGSPVSVGTGFVCDNVDRSNGLLSGQIDNDTYVYTSEDGGVSWSACTNITQRGDSLAGGFASGARLTALFDASDVLHVVWDAAQWNGYSGPFPYRSRLFHWDETSGVVRTAVDAVWDPIECNGGVFNLNVTQPQLSECDGKLYLTFVQYAPVPLGRGDDCALRAASSPAGAANGDIYLTVS